MFDKAYNEGFSAGLNPKPLKYNPDGTRTLDFPICPYTSVWQLFNQHFWHDGYRDGVKEVNRRWIKGKASKEVIKSVVDPISYDNITEISNIILENATVTKVVAYKLAINIYNYLHPDTKVIYTNDNVDDEESDFVKKYMQNKGE